MPIKVSCSCGAAFAAKDELAGRTVACPKCKQPLTIPSGAAPAQRPAAPSRPAPSSVPQPAPDPSAPSIFDEAGLKARQTTGQVCPSCYHAMKQGAIICVHCGYNMQLGRKMVTEVHGRGDGGHGEAAEIALQRAANMLEDDKREEKKKTTEGIPWWGYLILFSAAVGLLTMMLLLPAAVATNVALWMLLGAGWMIQLYAWICIYIVAFKDSVTQGLLVFFIPCYAIIYVIMKWDECGSLFLINLGGFGIQILAAGVMWAISAGSNKATEIQLPSRPEIAIVRLFEEPVVPFKRSNNSSRVLLAT
ncbi:MAG: hypothetical protein K8R36_20410 [Planctomycetales bacterium]|nr:hypothetical protein [Planctomycetales bacterium]